MGSIERRRMSEQSRGEEPSIAEYLQHIDVDNKKVRPLYDDFLKLGRDHNVKNLEAFAREATIKALTRAAIHPLSGLPTLTVLQIMSDRELSLAAREKKPLTVVFIDLNRFKHINDESKLKHAAGDAAIIAMGQALKHNTRPGEVFHKGGDEIFLVLQGADINGAINVAMRNLLAIPAYVGPVINQLDPSYHHPEDYSASAGIALYMPGVDDIDSLTNRADRALYLLKQNRPKSGEFAIAVGFPVQSASTPLVESVEVVTRPNSYVTSRYFDHNLNVYRNHVHEPLKPRL